MRVFYFLFTLISFTVPYGLMAQTKSRFNKESTSVKVITPNYFQGSDIERIQKAVDAAKGTTNTITIPRRNSNGTNLWKIDRAILLPSDMTILLDNCTIQLSDSCRDNMFRSNNVGIGITDPVWNKNIAIVGIGNAVLKGPDNPRATGDGLRTLSLKPDKGRTSYGSDAGKTGIKQTSDWRNFMILMAYVDGFKLQNVTIKHADCWAVTFERVHHAEVSDIQFYTPDFRIVNGQKVNTSNNDGIDLREGCKYFRIDHITGINGDDLIALSALDLGPKYHSNGNVSSYQVTSTKHDGPEDDIEQIFITNLKTNYTGVAIRASDSASIHHVYINGVITKSRPDIPIPYNRKGSPYTLLVGNSAYGKPAMPGAIHDIYAMNLIGDGLHLIEIKSPIADCVFMNGIYTGSHAPTAITYLVDKALTRNVTEVNLIKTPSK